MELQGPSAIAPEVAGRTMKRPHYRGILAAAVFAAAVNCRGQSNVYSLNVVSFCIVSTTNQPHFHEFLIGPESDRYGFREWVTSAERHLEFIHQKTTPAMIEWNPTSLAELSLHPFRLQIRPWVLALISVPLLSTLSLTLLSRRPKQSQESVDG